MIHVLQTNEMFCPTAGAFDIYASNQLMLHCTCCSSIMPAIISDIHDECILVTRSDVIQPQHRDSNAAAVRLYCLSGGAPPEFHCVSHTALQNTARLQLHLYAVGSQHAHRVHAHAHVHVRVRGHGRARAHSRSYAPVCVSVVVPMLLCMPITMSMSHAHVHAPCLV